ncbi:MAG TPA: response regulator [Candidatus Methylomirabilis sp.]|jgi:CheY-like chemotaxis protein
MGARILIADDSVTIQKVVELTFSREDFVLIPAQSGEEAIRKAKESRPDLMLIDLVMPDKNGYDVCRALREDPQLKATPIILLTGTFETFDRNEGLKVGANDFVTKPFESQTLITKVKQLLSPQAAPAAAITTLVQEPRAHPAPPPTIPLSPAPALVAPPGAAAPPAPEPVFELREEAFRQQPSPVHPAAVTTALPPQGQWTLAPASPPAPPGDLQELSLDDLTAEEPLPGPQVSPPGPARAEPAPEAAAAPPFELDLGPASLGAPPPLAEAEPASAEPAMPELDLDLLGASPTAAPLYDLEPLDLEAAPAPPLPGPEELLRDLEMAAPPTAVEPAGPTSPPAAPPAPPAMAPLAVEPAMARELEPPAAPAELEIPPAALPPAPSADAQAARLSAELAPYLAREIADRIVERIERVVWEVVPDLAEALIARELDRIKERAERRPPR